MAEHLDVAGRVLRKRMDFAGIKGLYDDHGISALGKLSPLVLRADSALGAWAEQYLCSAGCIHLQKSLGDALLDAVVVVLSSAAVEDALTGWFELGTDAVCFAHFSS